ncbi:MAG TPA: cytochrome c maturation protein CcmE [Thermoanaerobaculia bacterium]
MNRKVFYLLGAVLLAGFVGFSLMSFKQALTPYVSYQDARTTARMVQVAGALEKGSSTYRVEQGQLVFTLQEAKTHETLRVNYKGVRPGNFDDAISIVAIGRYDPATSEFDASKLLVKCPSKYQGAEVTKTYS